MAADDTTVGTGRLCGEPHNAEFERDMIKERTHAGLRTAHAAGRFGGRPRKFKPLKAAEIVRAITTGEKTPAEVALLEDVHVKTIHRLLAKAQ